MTDMSSQRGIAFFGLRDVNPVGLLWFIALIAVAIPIFWLGLKSLGGGVDHSGIQPRSTDPADFTLSFSARVAQSTAH